MEGTIGVNAEAILEALIRLLSTWGLRVIGAIAVLVIGWGVARAVRRSVRTALERTQLDRTLVPFVASTVYYLLLTFVLIAVLSLFGIETTSFIAVLGAAGLAVGLALQGTLANFSAGVMLLLFRPFKAGDMVETGGVRGKVVEIGIFSTELNTPDNVRVVVPNSAVYGETIQNYSANDTRRIDMIMGIAYGDDIGKAVEIIEKVIAAEPRVLKDPAPVVAVGELADSSVNLVVRPWCGKDEYWQVRWELTRRMKEELEAGGCSIPFPQNDVYLHRVDSAA